MQKYELVCLFTVTTMNENLEQLKNHLVKWGANLDKEDSWGQRKLAYPIEKESRAYYHSLFISLPGEQLEKLKAALKLSKLCLRFVCLKDSPFIQSHAVPHSKPRYEKENNTQEISYD